MGQNGEFVVKTHESDESFDGLTVGTNGKLQVFNTDNESCCCGGEPPEPPDPPDRFKCQNISDLPNAVQVSLGSGWSSGTYWIPRQGFSVAYMADGSQPLFRSYTQVIGATKVGNDFFGVQKWRLINSGQRNFSGTWDIDVSALPCTNLVDGQTYQLLITVLIGDSIVQVQVSVMNMFKPHYFFPATSMSGFAYSTAIGNNFTAIENKSYADHPVGTYNFDMSTELTQPWFTTIDFGDGESQQAIGEFIPNTWACTVTIPSATFEPKRLAGGTLDRANYSPCRQAYHAQLGSNNLGQSTSFTGEGGLPNDMPTSIDTPAYQGLDYMGITPTNNWIDGNPTWFKNNYNSEQGWSGSQGSYPITAFQYGELGEQVDRSFTYKISALSGIAKVPYDINQKVTVAYSVRVYNFEYEKNPPDLFNPAWLPEQIVTDFNARHFYSGVSWPDARFDGMLHAGLSSTSNGSSKICAFRPRAGGISSLEALNTVGFFGSHYAPEGLYQVEVEMKWYDRELPINPTNGEEWIDYWWRTIKVNGITIDETSVTRRVATLFHGHWRIEAKGDGINSVDPRTEIPNFTFTPIPDGEATTAATNDNDAFNIGIANFSVTTASQFKQTGFVGNFPPYKPNFHYVAEDDDQPQNTYDFEMEVGQSYSFPVTSLVEFRNQQMRFTAYTIVVQGGATIRIPIQNGFTINRFDGRISWTPERAFEGKIYVKAVSGYDQYFILDLDVLITDNDDDGTNL